MCTVTYVPLPSKSGFVLTSNRDEKSSRSLAIPPGLYSDNDVKLIYPKDPVGQGTWIAFNDEGTAVCLLNGAYKAHTPTLPYRHSRGLVVTSYFKYSTFASFCQEYNFINLEPFTLIVAEVSSLHELRWDGQNLSTKKLSPDLPMIWSSPTLYSPEAVLQKENWFTQWYSENIKNLEKNPNIILEFHKSKTIGFLDESIVINRPDGFKTVSITSIISSDQVLSVYYLDLQTQNTSQVGFKGEYVY